MRWGGDTVSGGFFSDASVVIFDFLVSFSIVIIETPQNSAPRYSGIVSLSKEAGRWRYVGGRNV